MAKSQIPKLFVKNIPIIKDIQTYQFFKNNIAGTIVFWKRFQLEILTIIRQLVCSTFFMNFSCSDLHWYELISNMFTLGRQEDINMKIQNDMSYFQKCELLNRNSVFIGHHFQ